MLYPFCAAYAVPLFLATPFTMAGLILDIFLVTAGQPRLALLSSLIGGIVNIVLDYVTLFVFEWGLSGAAVATGIGYSVSAFVGIWYFTTQQHRILRLTRPAWRPRAVLMAMGNGASEMVTQLSMSVVIIVINNTMMRLAGAEGVAAISITQYMAELFAAVYLGYAEGVAALTSFCYGRKDMAELRGIFRRSLKLIGAFALFTTALSILIAVPVTSVFVPAGSRVYELAVYGFRIYAAGFLFVGFKTYGSSFFTALGDGRTSALLSFCHTMLFLLGFLYILPRIFGVDGVFMATPAADFCGACMAFVFFWQKRKVYQYG
nr:polysaccharide biosynthesis C-terminal domain-containing protein [Anaeroglobus geminatus]